MAITKFEGDYAFLSNFYYSPIDFDGRRYSTVEHAFQAAKTFSGTERAAIYCAETPGKAKRLGRNVTLRSDWGDVKVGIMHNLLKLKFSDETLKHKLIATKERFLMEGNDWGDTFWGVCNEVGDNNLGVLLMKIRRDLAQ